MDTWQEIEPGRFQSSYEGPIPETLYRYRGLKVENYQSRLDQEIRLGEIYLSAFGTLNDSMEGHIEFRVEGEEKAIRDSFYEKRRSALPDEPDEAAQKFVEDVIKFIRQSGGFVPPEVTENLKRVGDTLFRVSCFTEDPLNRHMWRKYARWSASKIVAPYAGICIGYAAGEDFRNAGIAPVSYISGYPVVNVMDVKPDNAVLRDVLFVKNNQWSREKEWRVVATFPLDSLGHPLLNHQSRLRVGEEDGIKEIVVGERTPTCVVDYIRKISATRTNPLNMFIARDEGGVLVKHPL